MCSAASDSPLWVQMPMLRRQSMDSGTKEGPRGGVPGLTDPAKLAALRRSVSTCV